MAEVLGCQRAGEERRNVCKGSRALYGCRDVPRWVSTVGGWRTTSPHHPSRDVCTCCQVRMEGGGKADPPRLLAWSSKAGPWGGFSCHLACGLWDFPMRRLGASSIRYICSKGCPTCCPAGPNRWKRPWDILSSLRSHLWRRGSTTELEEDQRGATVAILQPSCQTNSHSQT